MDVYYHCELYYSLCFQYPSIPSSFFATTGTFLAINSSIKRPECSGNVDKNLLEIIMKNSAGTDGILFADNLPIYFGGNLAGETKKSK